MTPRQIAYQIYLKSDHWKNISRQARERDGHKCCDCGSTSNLEVHHKWYRKRFEDTVLPDLETLCGICHEGRHKTPTRRKFFSGKVVSQIGNRQWDEHGNLVRVVQGIQNRQKRIAKWKRKRDKIRRKNQWSF